MENVVHESFWISPTLPVVEARPPVDLSVEFSKLVGHRASLSEPGGCGPFAPLRRKQP
jgi:hypothetical protein